MIDLKRFGVAPPDGVISLHRQDSNLSPEDFGAEAADLLEGLAPVVAEEITARRLDLTIRLHSSGLFGVILLGSHPKLGDLRWHEYYPQSPATLRDAWGAEGSIDTDASGKPIYDAQIHNHKWAIASQVILAGKDPQGNRAAYQDRKYDVEAVSAPDSQVLGVNGLFRAYRALYRPDEPVVVETDGTVVRATPRSDRQIELGKQHFIPPGALEGGEYHTPLTPGAVVVTLAFTSWQMMEGGPEVLIAGPAQSYTSERRPVPFKMKQDTQKAIEDAYLLGEAA